MCKQIDHFPEDADYEADASEYFLRESLLPPAKVSIYLCLFIPSLYCHPVLVGCDSVAWHLILKFISLTTALS